MRLAKLPTRHQAALNLQKFVSSVEKNGVALDENNLAPEIRPTARGAIQFAQNTIAAKQEAINSLSQVMGPNIEKINRSGYVFQQNATMVALATHGPKEFQDNEKRLLIPSMATLQAAQQQKTQEQVVSPRSRDGI